MEGEESVDATKHDLAFRGRYNAVFVGTDAAQKISRGCCRLDVDVDKLLETFDICSLRSAFQDKYRVDIDKIEQRTPRFPG